MRNHCMGPVLAVVAVLASSPGILAQQPGAAKAPASATPDLSGVWMVGRGYRGFNRKEPPPMQPWAEEKYKVTREGISDPEDKGRDDKDPIINCAPPGPTRLFALPRPFEIIPIPGRVLLLFEWDHWVRQIWMDGREHPKDPDPTWMGHSIGRWDGETLVVDTVGLNDKTWLDGLGHPHSDALHIVERIRRTAHDTLQIDLTFDDPKAYTKPWTGTQVFRLRPGWEIPEQIVCEDHLLERVVPYANQPR